MMMMMTTMMMMIIIITTSIARRFSREIGKTNFQAQERGRRQRKSDKRL